MATFKYSARDAAGRVVAGAIDAETEVLVIGKLQETFNTLMVNMVRAGEVGGVLDDVLNRVATFFEKDLSLRQKVRAALTYPAAIMTFALGVIFFLVFFILPQFIGFFKGLDLVLPLPTRVLIFGTELLTGYWYVFLGFILLGLYGFRMYVNTSAGRFQFDKFKLRVPVFGPLMRKVTISRFTRTLGTLISSGVPIMQALEVVAKAVENKVVSQAIESVRSSIREGESIALPLQSSGLFPPMVVQMTAVGEETGTLDSMLQKVADFYDAEVETTLAQLTSILEPILIMFLGFVVGFIVLSFYMPLYQLITGIK